MSKPMRLIRFSEDVFTHTPFLKMVLLLIVLWLLFALGLYYGEHEVVGTTITSYGRALYWGIAAFSTAGIADTPLSGFSQVVGGIWIVVGSALFFGTIVATITTYFFRPLKRPARQIVDTIEYNLEQLDELSIAELDLLKETTDTLIEHMERIKEAQLKVGD
jgi:voltage-gated potassium channel